MDHVGDDIESKVSNYFGDRLVVNIDDLAAILCVEVKTLRGLANDGRIECLVMGNGRQRPRRRFTREHVIAFLRGASPGAAKGRHATELARVREAVRRQAAKVRS